MTENKFIRIALVGNPNCGKTTLFNGLTGLNQKIGNYPGVTVDKKTGTLLSSLTPIGFKIEIVDLPGAHSINGHSDDEKITASEIASSNIDCVIYVADGTNLKRSLYFYSQLSSFNKPVALAVNLLDLAETKGIIPNINKIGERLGTNIIKINARDKFGLAELCNVAVLTKHIPSGYISDKQSNRDKILERYKHIDKILDGCIERKPQATKGFTQKIDSVLLHPTLGILIFLGILFVIFQAIFKLSEWPMEWIEGGFSNLSEIISNIMPVGVLKDLTINGVVAGLSGVVIFVPQIALLFLFIALLEESGYMARVSYLLDSVFKRFGLNGKSVIPMVSGFGCAVPAIMSARTIQNQKERLITILITPLMTCSARIPVYILLISLVIPDKTLAGVFNLQGITLMGLYLIGFIAALLTALIFKYIIKSKEKSYFILELPDYQWPKWKDTGFLILEKVKVFVFDAGKIIMAISIILWALSSYGPGNVMERIEKKYTDESVIYEHSPEVLHIKMSAEKLEHSYAGVIGKAIEPVIRPLGFDWKIGIALITSFAAREVFVGTMASIFSIENSDDTESLKEKMHKSVHSDTGESVYTLATGISLMLFYAFAMQCMSTLAITYRETKGFRIALFQLGYMTALAWLTAFAAFNLLN